MKKKSGSKDMSEAFGNDPLEKRTISVDTDEVHTYTLRIWGTLEDPEDYIEEAEVISRATEDDEIIIDLNTCGGNPEVADVLVRELLTTKAHTICKVNSVASAGTDIALACKEWRISDRAEFMLHNLSVSELDGKINDLEAYTSFQSRKGRELAYRIYKGFLTDEEIAQLLVGKEFWFDATQTKERYEHWKKLQETPPKEEVVPFDKKDPSTWEPGAKFKVGTRIYTFVDTVYEDVNKDEDKVLVVGKNKTKYHVFEEKEVVYQEDAPNA